MSGHHKWPPPSGRITALSTTEAVETIDELLTIDEAEIARLREALHDAIRLAEHLIPYVDSEQDKRSYRCEVAELRGYLTGGR